MNSTTTRIGVIAGGAALLLLVIWYLALFQPQSHHLKAAHAAKSAADAQAQTLTAEVASLKALEKQAPQDKAALAQLKQAVPDNADLSDALGQLHNAATASGVQLTSVSPTPPPKTASQSTSQSSGGQSSSSQSSGQSSTPQASGPTAISLSMTASGTYQQLMSFVTHLDTMARTVVINQLGISSSQGSAMTANMLAQIFYAGSAGH
jgi:Tfp pilus assembly protein PilO